MIQNPCEGLTRAQTHAFLCIAIQFYPNCTNATLQALLDRGLIFRRKKPHPDYDYFVPRPKYNQWLRWAHERFEK